MLLQIHIAGAKRSGKTTVARIVLQELRAQGFRAVIFDTDPIRQALLRAAHGVRNESVEAPIGSELNKEFHPKACRRLFEAKIPRALKAGKTPIVTATHSRPWWYEEAERVAKQYSAKLRFIVLETPSLEETVRRAREDTSRSDTKDLTNPVQLEAYLASTASFNATYAGFQKEHLLLRQNTPEVMARIALEYILQK